MEIAVIGVSAIGPESTDINQLWRNIIDGKDCIIDIPENRWLISDYYDPDPSKEDKVYCKKGSFLDDTPFDALEFGIPPTSLELTDTTQLLALIAAKHVLNDACHGSYSNIDLSRASIILGVTSAQELLVSMGSRIQRPIWHKALLKLGLSEEKTAQVCQAIAAQYQPWREQTFPGLLGNVVAGRIANRFNFGGTNCVTDAACASSFSAISMGINELLLHQADLVITGGADTFNDIFMYMCFAKTTALSFSGICRPFDENSDGTLLGEGICLFALKRLEDAVSNGDRIYAVIKGVGKSSDGKAKSIYAPLAKGQETALNRAYQEAGYSPETVELVEAHGTGTKAGDSEEFKALNQVFSQQEQKKPWCALGSIKSQIGHTKAAAGAFGLFKIIMALNHKIYPPTINVTQPNSSLNIEQSPFYLNTRSRPWIKDQKQNPRRASVSSFGFGGTNFHITVEEYGKGEKLNIRPFELLLISGENPHAILEKIDDLQRHAHRPLSHLAKKSQLEFKPEEECRLSMVIPITTNLAKHLAKVHECLMKQSISELEALNVLYSDKKTNGKTAFIFAGQNSQRLYMGDQLAMYFNPARSAWDEVAGLKLDNQFRLHDVVFPSPAFSPQQKMEYEQRLNQSSWTQSTLAAHGFSQFRLLQALGIKSDFMIGHSFGELIALAASGLMDLPTLVKMSWDRGCNIEQHAPSGAMLAIIHPLEQIEEEISKWNLNISIANKNSSQQCVVSGDDKEIEKLIQLLTAAKIVHVLLKTKHPMHTQKMAVAAKNFRNYCTQLKLLPLSNVVLTNLDATEFPHDREIQLDYMANHMAQPVNFIKQLNELYKNGVRVFIEISPKKVLQNFVTDTLTNNDICAVSLGSSEGHELLNLFHTLAALSINAGIKINYEGLWDGYADPEKLITQTYSQNTVMITGSNFNRPYPPGKFDITPLEIKKSDDDSQLMAWVKESERKLENLYLDFEKKIKNEQSELLHLLMPKNDQKMQSPKPYVEDNLDDDYEQNLPLPSPALALNTSATKSNVDSIKPSIEPIKTNLSKEPDLPISETKPLIVENTNAHSPEQLTDIATTLVKLIAEKTGFNQEIIKLPMSLEADLGIDSIKRVEIFAAMRKELPNLPVVDPTQLARLNTLQEIVALFQTMNQPNHPKIDETPSFAQINNSVTETTQINAIQSDELENIFKQIIGEKTGFSPDIIKADMSLEADLGVDSIKRVEILAKLRKLRPDLPTVTPDKLAGLNSIAEILALLKPVELNPLPVKNNTWRSVLELENAIPANKPLPKLLEGDVAIVGKPLGLAQALLTLMQEKNIKASLVDSPIKQCDVLIYLAGLQNFSNEEAAIECNVEAFTYAKEALPYLSNTKGSIVLVQNTGGNFGHNNNEIILAWSGGLSGLAKTLRIEAPSCTTRMLDINTTNQTDAQIAEQLYRELLKGSDDIEIGINGSQRIKPVSRKKALSDSTNTLRFDDKSVILVTGGARGITAKCIIEVSNHVKPTFILLGRTVIKEEPPELRALKESSAIQQWLINKAQQQGEGIEPRVIRQQLSLILASREITSTIELLKQNNCQVSYHPIDICDDEAVQRVTHQIIQSYGPITGLIHAAGVIADKLIIEKSLDDFNKVFNTKVMGLRNLLNAIPISSLHFIVLFSSIAARYGNRGQSDYAMANEVLNRIAQTLHHKYQPNLKVKSINWSPWDSGMVTEELKNNFKLNGIDIVSTQSGTRLFVDELLTDDANDTEIILGPDVNLSLRDLKT
ncbi:type I polyketide synthase [Legionella brunensis]|uniref:type I polyketide synthase n=1 Tax=Legionella brunensis TaxID=29422 RepID=UPI001EE6DC8A|nr:type I polyketide synthase [Legionella brunensis]